MKNTFEIIEKLDNIRFKSKYVVHKADIEKLRSDIRAIRANNLKVGLEDNYLWKYESSPYGNAECWVAFHKPSEKYIGAASLYPRVVYVKGEPQNIWVAGDFSVDKDHRGTGLAIKILIEMWKAIWENEKYSWLYAVPNQKSKPLLYKGGAKQLGKHNKYVKVIMAEYLYKKTKIRNMILSLLLNSVIRLFSREFRYSRPPGISVCCINEFDDRFDAFWEKVKSQYPIIGERNVRFLQWRYSEKSGKEYRIFTLCRDDELIGYVVFYVRSQSCYIDDILCHRDPVVAETLIAEFSRFSRDSGYESIHVKYFGSRLFVSVFHRYNFYLRDKNPDEILFYSKEDNTGELLKKEENWHFLNGDSD